MKFRGGMGELMRQASRMQRRIDQRREELNEETFSASAGNDQVQVVANGASEIVSITVAPELLETEGLAMVQDLVVAATNAALREARTKVDAEIEKVTGGLKLPGMT